MVRLVALMLSGVVMVTQVFDSAFAARQRSALLWMLSCCLVQKISSGVSADVRLLTGFDCLGGQRNRVGLQRCSSCLDFDIHAVLLHLAQLVDMPEHGLRNDGCGSTAQH